MHKFLPVVASYLIYDIVVTAIRYAYARGIASEFDRVYRPKLAAEPFVGLTYPPAPNILVPLPRFVHDTFALRLIKGYNLFFKAASPIIPIILLVYWYVRLFIDLGPHDIVLYISLAMSVCLLVYAVLLALQAWSDKMLNRLNIVKGQF